MKGLINGLTASLVLVSASSFAHTGHTMQASFSQGFLHPLTGWDHLFALSLIGLFLSSFALRRASQISAGIMAAIIGGYAIGLEWSSASSAETLVASSLIGLPLALLVLKKGGLKSVIAASAILLFSLAHGLVQGAEAQGAFAQFGLGVMLASVMVVGATYFISRQLAALKVRLTHQ
ncbi:cobalamin-transporting ATPase activity [Vibrio sp. B1FLJ16]|uniref:HupE/UreJ family protein n=1 Tax=Vibrio sp. B1FLJ16 TaxID=2751178 RepID=UPI0015F78033|nr:HupE/UreJ family protein [Vibrio sp. B1FLJ16]CAD7806510.1 cobalamin-transporting ATPase activity [Vibrio sp. B1FLJ16]CAE6902347.1 cobalamin-transporting ATPase activity [Vibrio sp. B1FLJ16]